MYDKSKKTWSQRLKITKTEKSATTATASVTTTLTTLTPTTPTTEQQHPLLHYNQQQQQHLLSKANNATFINRSPQSRTSTTPTTPTTPLPRTIAAMHLPSATAKTFNEFHGNSGYDFSPSALSRSMKYAEPWIYGTVRGIPNGARPYPSYQPNGAALQHGYVMQHPAFFAHPVATSELAIVICSCPEYLNGTKRDMKKASICKKCKGSRLPLAPIGGTVRLRQSNTPLALKTRHSSGAATMRVVSSGKPARPTILDPTQDPYDLMRRSRLLSPEPSMPTKLVATPSSASSKSSDKARSHGKSESPSRGRSRTRPNLPQPLPTSKTKKLDLKSASHSGSNNTASFSDCWLVEDPQLLSSAYDSSTSSNLDTPTTSSARRSILRCNVNPYDLISSKSTNTSTSSPSSSSPTSASPTASNSSSSTPTTIMNPTETKLAKPAANMPNTPSPRANPKMAAKQQDFDVADAELYDEAPPFLTRSHSHSQSKSSQSSSAKASGNINHGRTKQQQPNERDVKSATSENLADDDDDEASVHDDESANDAPTKNKRSNNNNKKSYTNVKAIAGQRISLGETSRTAKKSLIKQSEDGRIYESIIIAGDEEYENDDVSEEDVSADDVVQMTVDVGVDNTKASNSSSSNDMRRNSAGNVPILPSRSRQDLEQQPKRPQRHNTRQKSEYSDETNATNSATTTTEATNHKSQQQQMATSKQLPQATTAAAATAPAIKSILKRPTITATEQHDGNKTATSHNSEEPTTTSRQEAAAPNTATTRQGRRQQMRAAKKELIEHLNSSSSLSSLTSSTSNNTTTTPATAATTTASATTPTATPTSTFYIPMPQARKKVQFMVEDRIIQPDDNVDNSDSDNNDNESNNKNVVIAAVNKADDNEEDDDDDVDDIEEDDEDEVKFDKASTTTRATTKSLNYEYYERKREQLKAMQQQQQNTTKQQKQQQQKQQQQIQQTQINTATAANPCGQPPAAGKCNNFVAASEASSFKSMSGLLELQQQQQQQQQLRDGDSGDNDDDAVDEDSNKVATNMKMKTTKGATPTKATALETTTTTTTTTTKAPTTNQQAAATMATLEHESNHVSSTLSASDAHNKNGNRNSNNNNKSNNNKHGSKNYGPNNNKKTTHIKAINKNERIADACSNKSADNNLLSHVATSTTSSSAAVTDAPTTTHQSRNSINNTTTITANYEVATVRQDIVKDAESIDEESKSLLQKLVENDDFEDDADDNSATVERNSENGETTLEARKKSPTQPLSAFVGVETELPLSRNPIRRSHSERQPAYNKLTNGCNNSNANNANDANKTSNNLTTANNSNSNNITNNNNAAIFNFKDTMALRMKNVRSDSRDLFASNSMATAMTLLSSVRPREPPPPPPPTIDSLTKAAEHCENTKVGTKDCSLPSSATTARRSSLSSLSLGCSSSIASEALSPPAGHEKHKKQDATARNAILSTNGLENHNNERLQQQKLAKPQQEQPPPQVVIIAPAAPLAATADGIAQTQATMATAVNSSKNQSNYTDNNSASCQVINRPTGSTDNSSTENVEAPNGSSSACDVTKPTDDRLTMKSNNNNVGHTIPTSPRRNNLQNNNNYGLFVKTNFTSSSFTSSSSSSRTMMTTTQPERTVVRVAPFNKTTSEVHRLKISHTDNHLSPMVNSNGSNNNNSDYNYDNDYYWRHSPSSPAYGDLSDQELSPFQSQKKTSILINGDDCYSTMNLSHDASTPLYQSSVVVADYSTSAGGSLTPTAITSSQQQQHFTQFEGLRVSATTNNTVTINVSSSPRRTPEEELIYQNNQINSFLSRQAGGVSAGTRLGVGAAIIPINGSNVAVDMVSLHRSASSTSSASATSTTSTSSSGSNNAANTKRGRTLIKLDYDKEKQQQQSEPIMSVEFKSTNSTTNSTTEAMPISDATNDLFSHEAELVKILRNPVEAVRRNLVPHVCGKNEPKQAENQRNKKMSSNHIDTTPNSQELSIILSSDADMTTKNSLALPKTVERQSFIAKLLEDPTLNQVAEGLENETIVQLIENSLKRLKESRSTLDTRGTKDNDDMMRLIDMSLQKLKEERQQTTLPSTTQSATHLAPPPKDDGDGNSSNRGSISSVTSFSSANNYEMFDFDTKSESDCYQSCSSEITSPGDDDANDTAAASKRSKFYQMLVDATLAEIELSTGMDDTDIEHHYESIRQSGDPIYEEIGEMPPPLPLSAPPLNDADLDKKAARSMFEGASKYEILSYLVDAKQRGLVREEPAFDYPVNCSNPIIIEEEAVDTLSDLGKRKQKGEQRDNSSSRASIMSDSSEDNQSTMSSLSPPPAHSFLGGANGLLYRSKGNTASDIERNDSGVGSETSKSSRSKYQHPLTGTTTNMLLHKNSPIHLCEDCDGPVETQISDSGVLFAPLVCRKCGKKRAERKEIITEIVETEEKYGRDLQIVLEEFCQPMLVAGLLTQEQLSAIFLNTEDLLENNQTLAERMRDALDIALEQGDDDLLTVNIGRIFLDFTQMLHAFESYCVRQAGASLLLANLEKEKELLRIFLKVSQMENTVLRRMNLNSFLMVPVQRVTKYPLLLARLYKVTPPHLEGRDLLKQAQEKIELHLNHINQEAKDVPTKLWRRISSSSPNRRASCEIDMINIKLRKMAIDVLEWNHDEVRFAMEGKLLFTQPTDSNWKKARTIKLTPVNALLVTNGKPSGNYKAEKVMSDKLNFPKHTGVREASLLLVKEKCGRYTLIREPLYLDRCVVCSEADWDDYFEVQEISSKDTFIFKAEDGVRTKQWYTQLQYHAQGMGAWRKRRNALANIMINGMLARS